MQNIRIIFCEYYKKINKWNKCNEGTFRWLITTVNMLITQAKVKFIQNSGITDRCVHSFSYMWRIWRYIICSIDDIVFLKVYIHYPNIFSFEKPLFLFAFIHNQLNIFCLYIGPPTHGSSLADWLNYNFTFRKLFLNCHLNFFVYCMFIHLLIRFTFLTVIGHLVILYI